MTRMPPTTEPSIEAVILQLRSHYRSGDSNLGRDFFTPCLSRCTSYRRAAGFFSSSSLVTWSAVLPRLAQPDEVNVHLIIGPYLSEADRNAMQQALSPESRDRLRQRIADRVVEEAIQQQNYARDETLRFRLLAWMIANDRLKLRFAFPVHVDQPGIFHEKIGIFDFPSGDQVAFTGSANESAPGHSGNFESIDVYRSWVPSDTDRVATKIDQFQEAWSGAAPGLHVLPLSGEVLDRVRAIAPDECPHGPDVPTEGTSDVSRKWRHQDEAVQVFLTKRHGILEMATGTGKTRTALRILRQLAESEQIRTVIIAADGTDLLEQWYRELLAALRPMSQRFAVLRHYHKYHERERFILNPTHKILLASRPALPAALDAMSPESRSSTLLVHDEVHRLGSPSNRENLEGLSDGIPFRLGLSATPEREYDEVGTAFIEQHIGPVLFRFDLADAILRRILVPFNYHALEYQLNDDDRARIQQVWARVGARERAGNPMSREEVWIELAKVHKTSRAKLPIFRDFIHTRTDLLRRCIIFVETREYGEEVLEIVHQHRHDFHTYFAAEDAETLRRFAVGELECLLTCHRLSEGIDIQSLENVILFSSARARLETIQRIGRCLRWDPSNPVKTANVIDFVRPTDPEYDGLNADEERRDWLTVLSQKQPESVTDA